MYTKEQIIDWCESSRLNRCYHCINYKPDDEGKCQIQTCGNDYFASTENYLKELAKFNDETPITERFLFKRFLKTSAGWRLNFDNTQILIQTSGDTYHILIYKRKYEENTAYIKTIGQLRMFLTIFGFGDFAKQLKS